MQSEKLDTRGKALSINLDEQRYGTFAEIGAGQEVVRWFFTAGGAAGTISKSISAYDMQVSDAIYGNCDRYVCRKRLQSMLNYEYDLNLDRLQNSRGLRTAFFTFADTVSARNFRGTNECHGWMGVKFQSHPRDEPSQIIIHVRMLDDSNPQQQEALGIVGVNLLYAAFFHYHKPEALVESLLDGLSTDRIEIDMIECSGIEFRHVDNRLVSLQLVQLGLSNAAMFEPDGTVIQPSEALYKKPILVERGSFRPVTHVNLDMIRCARKSFMNEPGNGEEEVVSIMEITMKNLMATGEIDYHDFLARADVLASCGKTVMISNYFEYYRLAAYLARFTKKPIGITMGAHSLREIFNEKYYSDLAGGILEALGRLFKNRLRLYIYPYLDRETEQLTTVSNLEVPSEHSKLFSYLVEKQCVVPLDNFNPDFLHIFSREILAKIKAGAPDWEDMVQDSVRKVIKEKSYFGHSNSIVDLARQETPPSNQPLVGASSPNPFRQSNDSQTDSRQTKPALALTG
jgi:hypothetical protein